MRLTLTSKAIEPSIMPCVNGGIRALVVQLLRPIAARWDVLRHVEAPAEQGQPHAQHARRK